LSEEKRGIEEKPMKRINVLRFFSRPSTHNPRCLLAVLAWGLVAVALVCVHASSVGAQTIYKYTDRDGAVVLTDKPPIGMKAEPFVTGEPAPKLPVEKSGSAMQAIPTGSMTAEEAIRQRDQKLDEVVKTVETRDREREVERQKRLQEAERLETEARQPMPSTRENRQRQHDLQQEAEKLRRAE
jgi:type IV secretory pathway VirB10-like protein